MTVEKKKIYLIGAGPGGADLITLRGLRILREAEVIVCDYLVDASLLEEARCDAEVVFCDRLAKKGRYSDGFAIEQEKITDYVIRSAEAGRKVIRLKNGDPAFFSRLSQELGAFEKAGLDYEVVPGVTAASAASALTGIPLTSREFASGCILVTGHEDPAKGESFIDYKALASAGTVVLYMAVANITVISERLQEAGLSGDTPAAAVSYAGRVNQRYAEGVLNDIAGKMGAAGIKAPAVIIIGGVVSFRKKFSWLEKNRKILFTGLSDERYFGRDMYFHLPLICIEPLEDYREFDGFLRKSPEYDWIVFASRYGAMYFHRRLSALGLDWRSLAGVKLAAVGASTAARLKDLGAIADLVPGVETSEGLAEALGKAGIEGKKIFMPRSDISDKGLSGQLEKHGARVDSAHAYRNVMPDNLPDIELSLFDEVMFTSPSTVRNFKKRYGLPPSAVKVSCIGGVTEKEAEKCGFKVQAN